jgi:hypothetical protein
VDDRIIRAKIEGIGARSIVGRWPITGWQAWTADYQRPGEYRYDGDWAPAAAHDGAAFHFAIKPFEVMTFRLRFA